MSLNSLIINSLAPLEVPVRFQKLLNSDGSPVTYITFFEYNQNGSVFADDEEQQTAHFLQVDIWSKTDYTELTKKVKNVLKNIGFTRNMETEFYENDTEYFHKVIRFTYTEEV